MSEEKPEGLFRLILSKMPGWQIGIFTFLMVIPMVVAATGFMLQVNVGAILQDLLDQTQAASVQTVEVVEGSEEALIQIIETSLNGIALQIGALDNRMTEFDGRISDMQQTVVQNTDETERKIAYLQNRVDALLIWACAHESRKEAPTYPEFCSTP